ncbi:MAG: MFS transporter [Bacteroidetes bacterium]|nr:MFS transporter [Bacteroidota bacterium]MBS1931642.1 MFS transporter [Bacteroidota bacterium]
MRIITRTVLILSLVSLLADVASEMLYPVIPVYLKEIGFTVFWIGLLEGLASFTAGFSKGYFGKLSDQKGIRLPLVRIGYFLSAVSKPMMVFFVYPVWVFFSRTLDRLGKGIRTAPRDALLSSEATRETKGRIFGFHRGMDTLGATIGPALTLMFLYFYPQHYKTVFYFAFIPGIISVAFLFFLKEKKNPTTQRGGNFFSFFRYWNMATPEYKKLVTGLLLFALINSSDIFLLLKTKEVTGNDNITIAAYIFYNLIFAIASYPLGALADKLSFKKVLLSGFLLFAVVYGCFAFQPSVAEIFILFFIYGFYAAATDGVSKAWLTNIAHNNNTSTAIGFYTSCESVCTFLSSIIAGAIWTGLGSFYTFSISALVSILVVIYFLFVIKPA